MPPTYNFNPSTGLLELFDIWGPTKFQKLINTLGVGNINQIIVKDGCRLSIFDMELLNIVVERFGYMTASYSLLRDIESSGVIRVRRSTIVQTTNDGQLYMTGFSRARCFTNKRHLNMSQSSMFDMTCSDHASVKTTSSYIVNSRATSHTSLCLGPSIVIDSHGSLGPWSKPGPGGRGFNRFVPDMQCLIIALVVLSQIDHIDSSWYTAGTPSPILIDVERLAILLINNAILPYDVAKEVRARVTFPDRVRIGRKMVSTVPAMDNLAKYVGTFVPPFK